jgi:hypothetical protein
MKDHHPGYSADMKIINKGEAELKAGFSAVKITPVIHDSWTDANGDAKYDPADGDTYTDGNGNGKFDPGLDCRFREFQGSKRHSR